MTVTIAEYLASAKQRLLADPVVVTFVILRERVTPADGHWRVKLTLSDGSTLEFSEHLHLASSNRIEVVTCSYHWTDAEDKLICRWDNTPHSPGIPGFPHHVHDGPEDRVSPGQPTDIFIVLNEIIQRQSTPLES